MKEIKLNPEAIDKNQKIARQLKVGVGMWGREPEFNKRDSRVVQL